MSTVFAALSMSLDGFIAGPDESLENPLGVGGRRLHDWAFNLPEGDARIGNRDAEVAAESSSRSGAVIIGRSMFDNAQTVWGDENPFGMPTYVVTHRVRKPLVKSDGNPYFFVDGIGNALDRARATANGKDIWIAGGANLIQQLIASGLLDELQISIIPVLLGTGRRLFAESDSSQIELVNTRVIESPTVTHLKYSLRT